MHKQKIPYQLIPKALMTISYLLFIAVQLNGSAQASQDSLPGTAKSGASISTRLPSIAFHCNAHAPEKHHFRLNKRFQPGFLFTVPDHSSAVIPLTYFLRSQAPDQDEPIRNTYLNFSSHRGPPMVV